jgi:hypothetical protein
VPAVVTALAAAATAAGEAVLFVGSAYVVARIIDQAARKIEQDFADNPPSAEQPCPEQPPAPKPVPFVPPIIPSTQKQVIPGQKYTDQTCSNERLGQLNDQLTKNKKAAAGTSLPFKAPKRPYDESDPAQAAKKELLCKNLREREKAWEDLIKTRDQIQSECFNSPKTTQDEQDRDRVHQDAREQAAKALANIRSDLAFYGCP